MVCQCKSFIKFKSVINQIRFTGSCIDLYSRKGCCMCASTHTCSSPVYFIPRIAVLNSFTLRTIYFEIGTGKAMPATKHITVQTT